MTSRNRAVFVRIALVLLAVVAGFLLFQRPVRRFETRAAVLLLRSLGVHNVTQRDGVLIQVLPAHHGPFRALVGTSCSAFASILTIACLGLLSSASPKGRRTFALLVACGAVAAGNVVRIAGSVAVGLVYGSSSLILFHDVVGSIFGLAYTLAGYLIMLHVLLPKRRPLAAVPAFLRGPDTVPSTAPAQSLAG